MSTTRKTLYGVALQQREKIQIKPVSGAPISEGQRKEILRSARRVIKQHHSVLAALRNR